MSHDLAMAKSAAQGTEAQHQSLVMQWARAREGAHPDLALLHHVANAGGYKGGYRSNAARATQMKRQGVRNGVPDLCLPVPRGGFHGFYGELKVGKNKPSPAQQEWVAALTNQGYYVVVRWGWEAMVQEIFRYIHLEPWVGTAHQLVPVYGTR